MTRVAAVDCGTNSLRLLVADVDADGSVREVVRQGEVVRLGAGVDRAGVISAEAMARTLGVTARFAATCQELGAQRVRFAATSAARDAGNAAEFAEGVRLAFAPYDVAPEVLTGEQEAALSFRGASAALRAAGVAGPFLVVDLGGGSTEVVRGLDQVQQAVSVDVGSVRVAERWLRSDPPSATEVDRAVAGIEVAFGALGEAVDLTGIGALAGVAGTVTTVAAHALGLTSYDREAVHLSSVEVGRTVAACEELAFMTRRERARLGFMHPGRVDVIGAGALVWRAVVLRVATASQLAHVVTCESDILDGMAASLG